MAELYSTYDEIFCLTQLCIAIVTNYLIFYLLSFICTSHHFISSLFFRVVQFLSIWSNIAGNLFYFWWCLLSWLIIQKANGSVWRANAYEIFANSPPVFFFFQILILSSVWQPDHSVLISSGEKKMIAEIKKVEEREYFSDFEFESSHSKAMERFYGKSKYFGQNPKSKR